MSWRKEYAYYLTELDRFSARLLSPPHSRDPSPTTAVISDEVTSCSHIERMAARLG